MALEKPVTCRDVEPLLTPYIDREATSAECSAVEAHLARCPPCAARARSEQVVHRVLSVRAASLTPRAPEALKTRCRSLAGTCRTGERRRGWLVLRPVAAVVASVFVACAAIVAYGAVSGSSSVLAAEMTLDHLKCFGLFEGRSAERDSHVLETRLHDDYGWRIGVPAGAPAIGLRLVGGRRCLSHDGTVAHLMYRHADHPVSLFVVSKAHADATLGLVGNVSHVWSRGDVTYVVVASESAGEAQPVFAYFATALR